MPVFRFQGPDGKIHRVEAETEEAARHGLEETLAAKPGPVSQPLGFAEGVNNVAENAVKAVQNPGMLSLPAEALNMAATVPAKFLTGQVREQIDRQEEKGVKPGGIGEFVGSTLASAPIAAAAPGAAIGGAVQGFLASHGDHPIEQARDAIIGAGAGKLGEGVVKAGADALRGITDPAARLLSEHGVRLPPSAVFPRFKPAEEALTSVPLVGGAVRKVRGNFRTDVQRAAINRGLKEIGDELPQGMTGEDAVGYAQDAISDYYDNLLPNLSAKLDPEFGQGLEQLSGEVGVLPAAYQKQFQRVLQDHLTPGEDGVLTGRQLKDAETAIGQEVADYSGSGAPADVKMRRALQAAREELRAMIARQNPEKAPDLQAANRAFRIQAIIDDAASKADNSEFSSLQLKQASRKADRTVRKRGTARGEGSPLQGLATAARTVEKAVMGNSGTADRVNLTNPLMWAAGLPALAGYRVVQAGAHAMSGSRPTVSGPIAQQLERLARPLGLLGSSVASYRRH